MLYQDLYGKIFPLPDSLCLAETAAQSKKSTWSLPHTELFREELRHQTRECHCSIQRLCQSPIRYTSLDFWLYWAMPEIDKFTFSFFFDIVTFCVHSEVDDEDWHKQNTVIVFLKKKKQSQLHPFDLYKPDLVKIQWNPHKLSLKIISFLDPATTRIWVIFLILIFSAQFLSHWKAILPFLPLAASLRDPN